MATDTEISVWQKLLGRLRNAAETDTAIDKALTDLNAVARSNDERAFHEQVAHIFNTYGGNPNINITSSDINLDSLLEQSSKWREKEFLYVNDEHSLHEGSTAPPEGVTFSDFFAHGSNDGGSSKSRTQQLYEDQRAATMKAFEALLNDKTISEKDLPAAIERFYHDHLSAEGVLGSQYKIVEEKVLKLRRGNPKQKQKGLDALEREAEEIRGRLHQDPHHQEKTDKGAQHVTQLYRPGVLPQLSRERRHQLTLEVAGRLFDESWRSLGLRALEGQFRIGASFEDVKGYGAAAETVFQDYLYEETPPEPVITPQAVGGGRGTAGQLAQGAYNTAQRMRNNVQRAKQAADWLRRLFNGAGAASEGAGALAATGAEVAAAPEEAAAVGTGVGIGVIILIAILCVAALILLLYFILNYNSQQQYSTAGIVQNAQLISSTLCREKMNLKPNSPPWYDPCTLGGGYYDNFNPNWKQLGQPQSPRPWDDNTFDTPAFSIKIGSWSVHNNKQPICQSNACPEPPHIADPKYWIMWGKFWCTDLVINSYAAAGFKDIAGWSPPLSIPVPIPDYYHWTTGTVDIMILFFENHPGYRYIPASQFNPDAIPPGAAIFFQCDPNDLKNHKCFYGGHTAIVQSIDQNLIQKTLFHTLNGKVTYIQANAGSRTDSRSYRNGVLDSSVVGFGVKLAQ